MEKDGVRMRNSLFVFVVVLLCPLSGKAQTEIPVTFNRENLQLVGMLHLPENVQTKVPAVLLLHGFTGHKSDTHFIFTRLARSLAASGVAVLRFDFAGSGDSEGEFADMTILTELQDAKTALKFFQARPEIDTTEIGLLGFSMGGCVAALLVADVQDFQTLVLWAPVAFPVKTFAYIPKKYTEKMFQGRRVYDLHGFYVSQKFLDILPALHPLQSVKKFMRPALVIQGGEDKSVYPESGKAYAEIFRLNNPESHLELIDNANHVFSSMELTEKVVSLTKEWFLRYLKHDK